MLYLAVRPWCHWASLTLAVFSLFPQLFACQMAEDGPNGPEFAANLGDPAEGAGENQPQDDDDDDDEADVGVRAHPAASVEEEESQAEASGAASGRSGPRGDIRNWPEDKSDDGKRNVAEDSDIEEIPPPAGAAASKRARASGATSQAPQLPTAKRSKPIYSRPPRRPVRLVAPG